MVTAVGTLIKQVCETIIWFGQSILFGIMNDPSNIMPFYSYFANLTTCLLVDFVLFLLDFISVCRPDQQLSESATADNK